MASHKQTFIRAFKRAQKNGYIPIPHHTVKNVSVTLQNNLGSYVSLTVESDENEGKMYSIIVGLNDILFDHAFAQSLWGDKFINPVMRDDTGSKVISMKQTAWKHNLRQMVTADNPITCLGTLL